MEKRAFRVRAQCDVRGLKDKATEQCLTFVIIDFDLLTPPKVFSFFRIIILSLNLMPLFQYLTNSFSN